MPLNALTTVPTVDELAVSGYPDTAPRLVDGTAAKAAAVGGHPASLAEGQVSASGGCTSTSTPAGGQGWSTARIP